MSPEQSREDERLMQHALQLAQRGVGTTSPNPAVGAVIVKDGSIIGEGYHEQAGQAHAERRAIADAVSRGCAEQLRGATIYVTLEPCSSYGRTPPCTEAILEAGISRVVYGAVDPDKRHRGRADALLRAAGVQVQGRVAEEACRAFLEPWAHAVQNHMPWVTAKIAGTLDGRTTRKEERWLSCAESLAYVHQLRAESDAILVGGNTVRLDKPALTIRHLQQPLPACKQQPWRVVLTRQRSSLPMDAPLFADAHADRTLVYEHVARLSDVLHELYENYGVVRLMLECGGGLLRRFLEQGLVQEWVQVITPHLGGGPALLLPGDWLPAEYGLRGAEWQPVGQDMVLRGRLTLQGAEQLPRLG